MSEQTVSDARDRRGSNSGGPFDVSRLSCTQCRTRKLKCDRSRPCCGRCIKLGDVCAYPQSRLQPVRRGNRATESETKTGQPKDVMKAAKEEDLRRIEQVDIGGPGEVLSSPKTLETLLCGTVTGKNASKSESHIHSSATEPGSSSLLEHPLCSILIKHLISIYFDKLHHASPMLHRQRFIASLDLPTHMQPPLFLQYTIMALAAASSDSYRHLSLSLYQRAKVYANCDDIENHCVTLAHAQYGNLLAKFEAEHLMFARASMSLCHSVRIAQILNLDKVDAGEEKMNSELGAPNDWVELEERRRTWWVIFCCDRFVSATTKWPALIQVQDIHTLLPSSDEAYESGCEEKASLLVDALHHGEGYSSFAGRVIAAHLFYHTLEHTFQVNSHYDLDFGSDPFWERHRDFDNDIAIMLVLLPKNLRLPGGFRSQNAVFVNAMLHAANICLHKAALWRVLSQSVPDYMERQYQNRLLPAAEEILSILKMTPDIYTTLLSPLINFSAYMAAVVFLEDVLDENSSQSEDNLEFMLQAMVAVGKTNPVTRSLAKQLVEEMAQHGIEFSVMEKVKDLPSDATMVPLLAKPDPRSPSITFCVQS